MLKHYVTFQSPGTFFAEETTLEITSCDVSKAIELLEIVKERYDARPYAFRFTTRELYMGGSNVVETSGFYYINGVVETLEQIKAKNDPANSILIDNMECNGWDKVVTTYSPYRWTRPFKENDCVINIP